MRPLIAAVFPLLIASSPAFAQVLERDALHRFTVTRPAAWEQQERPAPAIRIMLGIEGNGYVGNCNISVLRSASTSTLSQAAIDANENKRPLTVAFFQAQFQGVAPDVKVLSVKQVRRGTHHGHLVNYTYSYVSPSIHARVYLRAEFFSHSRQGRVYSFTCNTGALSPSEADRAFEKEARAFEHLSASLQPDA